jgi:hypothetical protein
LFALLCHDCWLGRTIYGIRKYYIKEEQEESYLVVEDYFVGFLFE